MKASMSYLAVTLILLTVICTVVGQILVKQGALEVGGSPSAPRQLPGFLLRAFTNWHIILGLMSAALAAVAWVMALSHSDLGSAYPFMGLTIVVVLALSGLVFGEQVPWTRWVGVLIVCLGIWVASR